MIATAPLSIDSNLTVALVTIGPSFKLGAVLMIQVDGHGSGLIVEVLGLRADDEPINVNEELVLNRDIDGAISNDEKAMERPPDKGI